MTLALIRTAIVAFPRGRDVVPFKERQVLFWFWKVHNNSKLIVLSSVAKGIPAIKLFCLEIPCLMGIISKNWFSICLESQS